MSVVYSVFASRIMAQATSNSPWIPLPSSPGRIVAFTREYRLVPAPAGSGTAVPVNVRSRVCCSWTITHWAAGGKEIAAAAASDWKSASRSTITTGKSFWSRIASAFSMVSVKSPEFGPVFLLNCQIVNPARVRTPAPTNTRRASGIAPRSSLTRRECTDAPPDYPGAGASQTTPSGGSVSTADWSSPCHATSSVHTAPLVMPLPPNRLSSVDSNSCHSPGCGSPMR